MSDPANPPAPAGPPADTSARASETPAADRVPTPGEDTAALELVGLHKRFGQKVAVADLSLRVPTGSFYGLVGPNGAGKTTTLSMATGLLAPDAGRAIVHGMDVWQQPVAAKRMLGNLADGVKLFDRLTGEQLVTYNGLLFGLPHDEIAQRTADLLALMDMTDAAGTMVVDYSAGMTKKIALACALVHAPRLLVLDEPFESVDPVSAANIQDILTGYVAGGGTVIISSHSMDLVQRMCDHVAIVAAGRLLVAGSVEDVRAGQSLQDRFVELVGGRRHTEGPEWLRRS
ncbi:ABC transporter ATP-binding protein [Microbacterium sp. CCNWLW41]|uniref:ABC transporter ATP-binding protein n=1 Tax=unclassified Microbacterium TaxID=2609290 RepID=UPI003FA590A2